MMKKGGVNGDHLRENVEVLLLKKPQVAETVVIWRRQRGHGGCLRFDCLQVPRYPTQ